MNLLDNELVRKYFDPDKNCDDDRVAWRILYAMQQPIRKGERYLNYTDLGIWREFYNNSWLDFENFHPWGLRLPDAFQKQPHSCDCEFCGHPDTIHIPAKPTPSPEKCECCANTDPKESWKLCKCSYCNHKPKDAAEKISELICHWFSNGLIGTPNPESLTVLLRDLVRLTRETKELDK